MVLAMSYELYESAPALRAHYARRRQEESSFSRGAPRKMRVIAADTYAREEVPERGAAPRRVKCRRSAAQQMKRVYGDSENKRAEATYEEDKNRRACRRESPAMIMSSKKFCALTFRPPPVLSHRYGETLRRAYAPEASVAV